MNPKPDADPPLLRLSDEGFAELRDKAVPRSIRRMGLAPGSTEVTEWIFHSYCERLLFKNERLQQLAERYGGHIDSASCWSRLTEGQRTIYCLGMLDIEVPNGGLTQFFWNHPAIACETTGALRAVTAEETAAAYCKAVEMLIAHKDRWIELKSEFDSEPTNLRPFQASYRVLDLAWFDQEYLGKHHAPLCASAVGYIEAHKKEFITG